LLYPAFSAAGLPGPLCFAACVYYRDSDLTSQALS